MNHRFIFLVVGLISSLSTNLRAQCDTSHLIIDQNFNVYLNQDTAYSTNMLNADFPNVSARTSAEIRGIGPEWPQETRAIDGELRAEYIKNDASGRSGGFLFDSSFEGAEEATLEYKLKFDKDFVWATGGKLPGLGGASTPTGGLPAGCTQNEDLIQNAFSCRLMWRRNRARTQPPYIIVYPYFPNRETNCGGHIPFIRDIEKEKWYTIKQYIKLNTPGVNDGILQMYVDGELMLDQRDVLYRLEGKDNIKINNIVMHTYRGGSRTDTVWHSPTTDYAYFDDVKLWTRCGENVSAENQPPLVSFLYPAGDTTVLEGYKLSLEALATDSDGTIDNVEIYINDVAVRQEKVFPYLWGHENSPNPDELNNLPIGVHEIKAVATDNRSGTSVAKFDLTVDATSNTINSSIANQISIFPVPFNHIVNIKPDMDISSIEMYDITGKLLIKAEIQKKSTLKLNTDFLPQGIYFIKLRNINNKSSIHKVVKH